jgi:hypothetical protein
MKINEQIEADTSDETFMFVHDHSRCLATALGPFNSLPKQ